ncbi:unnamed protein product [Zymoseptoria tritici ST99CH_1A5]|uniref:DUF2241 domain-containing protein n=3 Tax=Zymoseptoria tritici TaxID=1047171 RepID=A0A1X7RGU6_ZYMT9|nr:unnamed protein product [Zymoseptoria tritici ST99CH_3D7]SMR45162.1 unnamed protein product [Zymoseptoria tritici ST99CH_3D1]SMY20325.1 unnamed protein product [Zymoseptoria tritici ST99CH_1A5]
MASPTTTTPPASSGGGGTNLDDLIKTMNPTLDAEEYVFAELSLEAPHFAEFLGAVSKDVKMLFREKEAWTIILPKSAADREGLYYTFPCRQVTLNVHSSLEAVGFLAAITTRLAEKVNVGVNAISGYYHDHLFVPVGKEDAVMEELLSLAAEKA